MYVFRGLCVARVEVSPAECEKLVCGSAMDQRAALWCLCWPREQLSLPHALHRVPDLVPLAKQPLLWASMQCMLWPDPS